MTDRELLELAAKAVGIKKDDSPHNGGGLKNDGFDLTGNLVTDWHNNERWNPLRNDGDAMRLAVKLRLRVFTPVDDGERATVGEIQGSGHVYTHSEDGIAATRRAIVLAAAKIGRRMK